MSLKEYSTKAILVVGFAILISGVAFVRAEMKKPIYLDPNQPTERRVEDLLSRMTLEEKVGQMNVGHILPENELIEFIKGGYKGIGPAGGFYDYAASLRPLNDVQRIAVEQTRLGIPLIQVEEGMHGLMVPGATIFPEGLAIGSTWNMDLVREIYSAVAREARAIGVHQISVIIEPYRDPRLGRNQEVYSEDPYLCSCVAEAIVKGAQGRDVSAGDKVIAMICHFPGQSQPVSGLEHGAMEISERALREVYLPVWVGGIKKAGALAVMATYPAIDGIPAHASEELLTKMLREELGFTGCVFGEGRGLDTLIYNNIVATQKEAGRLAVKAGVDVALWFEPGFMKPLIENVQEGNVSMEIIDRAVRRILKVKFLLGLFENPYIDLELASKVMHSKQHQELALHTAREGIVLLKNQNNLLPLDKNIKSIAVIGPNADNERNQLGDYIPYSIPQEIVTILDGIKNKVPSQTKVTYISGCDVFKTDTNEILKAQDAAGGADVAIVVVGENERYGKPGTDGEGRDVADLDLTGLQEDLVKAVVKSGTPTIVVLINGRPLSIRWIAENVPAILEAWLCGEQGGNAVADVLFGDYNPAGRLPVTVPRHVGQLPVYYNYKPSKAAVVKKAIKGVKGYVNMPMTPLYEFGYGLSYTKFEYSNLQITLNPPTKKTGPASEVHVSLDVKNVGDRKGDEVVQLYIDDCLSSVVTPVKELKGFERITLSPGQKEKVGFTLTPYDLSLLDRHLQRVVEPGTFEVMVGASSEDIRLRGTFEVKD